MEQAQVELLCIVAPLAIASLLMTVGRVAARMDRHDGYNPIINTYNQEIATIDTCKAIINHPNASRQLKKEKRQLLRTYRFKHFVNRVVFGNLESLSQKASDRPPDPQISREYEKRNPWLK